MRFWPLTNSDFQTNQTFHKFHDLDNDFNLHRIMIGFHGAFATCVACQQGTLTLPDTWLRPPILGLACAPIVETRFFELAMSLLDFSTRIPLGTFSILLITKKGTISVQCLALISWVCKVNVVILLYFLSNTSQINRVMLRWKQCNHSIHVSPQKVLFLSNFELGYPEFVNWA